MSDRVWSDYLEDIRHAAGLIQDFTRDQTYAAFEKDIRTQFAVIRCFEIIGEASKRVPYEAYETYPGIPWKVMAGMRDRLIHGYDQVNVALVWRTAQVEIPKLLEALTNP